jgi:AraC-like DNA-binding protein
MTSVRSPRIIVQAHKKKLDDLCEWIDAHIGEAITWQMLMAHSGLDFQTLQILFYHYKSTTPMTWIRRRREAARSKSA